MNKTLNTSNERWGISERYKKGNAGKKEKREKREKRERKKNYHASCISLSPYNPWYAGAVVGKVEKSCKDIDLKR